MDTDVYISSPDPSLSLGYGYASTGETAEEYAKRLENMARFANGSNIYFKRLYDKDFVRTLPYTATVDETDGEDENESVTLTPRQVFLQNLQASFGPDISKNEALYKMLESEDYELSLENPPVCLYTTEIGGNEALNCYWSFNETDDVIYPSTAVDPDKCTMGVGRVYFDMYQRHQVVLWLTFGVPEYKGLWEFLNQAVEPKLAAEMHAGTSSLGRLLGRIAGGALIFGFKLATLPLYVMHQIGKVFQTYKINKYVELRTTMPLYFKGINNLMNVTAVNMGIQKGEDKKDVPPDIASYVDNMPLIMRDGLDIYKILTKWQTYQASRDGVWSRTKYKRITTDELYEIYADAHGDPRKVDAQYSIGMGNSILGHVLDSVIANATGSTQYIGFKVEKNVNASESFSNSTGQSDLSSKLNSMTQAKASFDFSTAGGKMGSEGITGMASNVLQFGKDLVKGAISMLDISNISSTILNTGYYDIPEMYQSSNFSTSYSFSMNLVSHYGDRVSVFQNCYIPLFCILAGALPRQIGKNTYVSPFVCRAYCRGRFAVSYGIIDSVSITRGDSEYGWTDEGYATKINININIKDLSPVLFVGLSGLGSGDGIIDDFFSIFESNNNMQEYLATLSGLGLKERILFIPNVKRKYNAWYKTHFETKLLNPYWWGSTIGNIPILQTALMWKWSRLSNN